MTTCTGTSGIGSEIVSANVFGIIPGPAIISNVSPNTGNEGQEVVFNITGNNTHWQQNYTQFYIAGQGGDLQVNSVAINSPTSATVDMNISQTANPGPRSIYMVTAGESLTDSGAFVVTGGVPVITYLNPNNTSVASSPANSGVTASEVDGLQVTINGRYTTWLTGTPTVSFGPGITVVSSQVDDDTHISALINIAAGVPYGYRTVAVTGSTQNGTQTLTSNFLLQAPPPPPTPYIGWESPTSGLPGQTLTLDFYGVYTEWNPTTTLTGFYSSEPDSGITINSQQMVTPTHFTANITIGPNATASWSTLTLTTPGTQDYGPEVDYGSFAVVIAQPTLSIVDPGSGMQGAQNQDINVIGQFTAFKDGDTSFSFGTGITVNSVKVLGQTIATVNISIDQLASLGGRSVIATTPSAQGSLAYQVSGAGFSVNPSLAQMTAVTPNTTQQGQSVDVAVTGANTHWSAATTFNFGSGIAVQNVHVVDQTDATMTLVVPALASEGPTWASATTLGEVASMNNAFVVTAGTPLLLSSGPGSLPQQSGATFTILSQATHWLSNPPIVSYGSGVVVTNTSVTSDTSLTAHGYVQPTTYTGWRDLTVTAGSQVLTLYNALYVAPGPAVINSVLDNATGLPQGGQNATLNVTITGINTNWQQGVTKLNFPNVLVNTWSVTSPTTITANITVSITAPAGQVSVTTTTLGEVATGINVFNVIQTQPELLGLSPTSETQAWTGTVNLTGAFTHFNSDPTQGAVTTANFGAGIAVNSVTATDATHLTANITVQPTANLGYRNVSVATGTEALLLTNAFQVMVGNAAISNLSPAYGQQNASYTISVTGSQTHFCYPYDATVCPNATLAHFDGGIGVTSISVTDTEHATVHITVPPGTQPGYYYVSLTTGGEVASIGVPGISTGNTGFQVTSGTAIVSAVNPPTGHQGAKHLSVALTGTFTHFDSINNPTTSVASFGSGITVNSLTVIDATHAAADISIDANATIASRNVTVSTAIETATLTGGFSVLAGVPALVSVAPTSGAAGNTLNVTIAGQFTKFQSGFSSVNMGSDIHVNFITNVTFTSLTANVTIASNAAPGNRDVSVTTNGATQTLSSAFTVLAGTPAITVITPNIGVRNSQVTVSITGLYTNWVNGTTVVSFGPGIAVGSGAEGAAGSVTVNSTTSLAATLTIDPSAGYGPRDLTITTGSEVETVPGGFTVQPQSVSPPSLISISPGINVGGDITINSNIVVVFSQPMDRTTINTGSMTMQLYQNGTFISVLGTVSLDAAGRVATFTPNSLLAPNSQFYFTLSSNIKDATGNGYPGNSWWLYTNFSYAFAPTVVAANPPATSTVGNNVPIQIEFSSPMDQSIASGLTVTANGNPVAGTYSWNSTVNCCSWGPGTILYFSPTSPLSAGSYTVSWDSPLVDTAGNLVTPGSFSFTVGSSPDTAQNYTGPDFQNGVGNVGTNFAPKVNFSKPVDPIDINTGTLLLYNGDSGKYVNGAVTLAPGGMSATFTPTAALLPNTYYRIHMAWGNYDADGNYLYGTDSYFTTGAGTDSAGPSVASISPADQSISIPVNTEIVAHFSEPIDPSAYSITVTPSAGSPAAGTATLSSDNLTLTFVPTDFLQPGTLYTVQVSGFQDMVGISGTTSTTTFTTANSAVLFNLSTGLDASGNLITTGDTVDPHWSYVSTSPNTSGESNFLYPGDASSDAYTGSLKVVAPGNAGWYGGWGANGPSSSWIAINPDSVQGNTYGFYSTSFTMPSVLPPSTHICLAGYWSHDDNALLALNGTPIMGDQGNVYSLSPLNIDITSNLLLGSTNYLTVGFGSTDNSYEGARVQAVVESCGASETAGTSLTGTTSNLVLTSATPGWNAQNVPTNTNIALTFNNALDPATVNSSTLPVMISNQVIAGGYVVTGSGVNFTPDSPFPTNTQVSVNACNGPYDLAGDSAAYNGCGTQLDYFNTGSTATPASTPFQATAITPAANATNVGLRAPVTVTFNRSVNLGTVNQNDWGLFAGDGQSPWCSTNYSHSQDDATLEFNCYPLPSSATMTGMVNSGLQDWQGNGFTANSVLNGQWQFSTTNYDSNTNGTFITIRPGSGAGGVDPNLPLTFYSNLPIDPSTAAGGLQVAVNNTEVSGTVQVLGSGYTMEFTPNAPWPAGALVQWWTTGSIMNTTYETPFNTTSGYFYVAGDTSQAAPAAQTVSPSQNTSNIPLNSVFDLQFNVPINASTIGDGTIYLYDSYTSLHIPVVYSEPQPNEVLMTPVSSTDMTTRVDLPAGHYVYLYFNNGLTSTTSVPANSTGWYYYTGGADDATTPIVTNAVPFNGAKNVGVNATPGVAFNKAIDPVSVNAGTFQVLDGSTPLAGSFWLNSSDTRATFVPNGPLPPSSQLTISLNGVIDPEGHAVTYSSTFGTASGPDYTAPSVVWSSVTSNTSIPTNSMITVQFNESMDSTTFTAGQPGSCGNFDIYDLLNGWNCIGTTLQWSPDQSVAYLTPTTPLAAGRQYYLSINSGTDLAGNQMSGDNFYFSAEYGASTSGTAPAVVAYNPINGDTVGTNAIVEVRFSAPVDPTTVSGVTLAGGGSTVPTTPVLSAGNTVLQLVPAAPLAGGTTYTVSVQSVTDAARHAVTGTLTNSFTTEATYDINPPSLVSYDPPNNATVGTNTVPKMVFSKPLNPIFVSNSTFQMVLCDTNQWIPLAVTQSADGKTITMTPQVALLTDTRYQFYVGWGAQDEEGNTFGYGWYYFYTGDNAVKVGPTVSVSPANGATGMPLNTDVIVSVSAPIDPTSWNQNSIQLLDASMNPVAGTVSEPNNQTLVFRPSANLAPGAAYTVNVGAGAFADANGNPVSAFQSTFTTDTAGTIGSGGLYLSNSPSVTTNSSGAQVFTLTFSQLLDPNSVNPNTLKFMYGPNQSLAISGTYAVSSNLVSFTPTTSYPAGTNIYVYTCNGPTDVLGEYFSGCWNQLTSFYVSSGLADTVPFYVSSVSPANGTANVGREQTISVTFSKAIDPSSIYNNDAVVYAGQDVQDRGSFTLSSDNRTLYFNIGALSNGTTYTISLPMNGITDQSGNYLTADSAGDPLAGPYISTFTTMADPATGDGSVQGENPGNNATGVPIGTMLTLYMNRQVNPSTVAANVIVSINGVVDTGGLVTTAADNYEIQFSPSAGTFPNGATVQWWLSSSVMDVYGNNFNIASGVFYTAAAVDPSSSPQIVAVSPSCCGSVNVPTNAEIDIQYSLPIDATTLSGNVWLNSGQSTPYTVSLASPNVVRIAPNGTTWDKNSWYGFCVNSNVKGLNGVGVPYSCYATYFTTTSSPDSNAGTVTIGPPNGVSNVGTNADIRVQFSKPADRTTVNSSTVSVTAQNNAVPVTFTYNYNGADLVGANVYPVNPLPPSTPVTVNVNGILDYAGNAFNQPSATFTTAALPDYTNPSVAMDFSWWQTGIATNASFTCHYSEPIDPSSVSTSNTYVYSFVTNSAVPATYVWSPDMMSLTMTPKAPLDANSEYYYTCQGAIDLTGNGQNGDTRYFYTGNGASSSGPQLVYANPPSGMQNVPINTSEGPWYGSSLYLLFNEPVSQQSIGNITLTPQNGSAMPISVYFVYENEAVSVQLPWSLSPNTTYTFDVSGVTDLSGNPASATTTSSFKTGSSYDWTSPTVASTDPANGDTPATMPTSVSITFSEAMDPVLIGSNNVYLQLHNTQTVVPTTISFSPDYVTVTLTPVTPLTESTIYDLVVYGNNWWPYDIAGNQFSTGGYVSWNNGYVFSTFTTPSTGAIDGQCDSTTNGKSFSTPPTANLCSAGAAGSMSLSNGSMTWMCNSPNGGNDASCSATVSPTSNANSCTPQPSGLVSWWPGDLNTNDLIGGNNGTLENGAGFATGLLDYAFSLDGSNQFVYVSQPVPTNLQIQNAMTMSAWVYPTAYPTNQGGGPYAMIMGSQQDGASAGAALFYNAQVNNGGISGVPVGSVIFNLGNGSGFAGAETMSQVPLNQWTLVTGVASANNPTQIYFNGTLQPTASYGGTWNGTVAYPQTDWFSIGQQVDRNRPFTGLIDDAQVYNVALSSAQVQSLYTSGNSGSGICQVQTASTTTVSSSGSPAQVGDQVTFTADVSPSSATGTITFMDGSTPLGSAVSLSSGEAQLTTSALTLGVHKITAVYSGDSTYSGSVSSLLNQIENLDGALCAPQPAGLLDWYPAELNANDIIGGNNGAVEGSVAYAPGVVGQAFSMNGSGDVALSLPSLNTSPGSKATVSFWMYWNGGNWQGVFENGSAGLFFLNDAFGFTTGSYDVWGIPSSGLANTWTYVTAVFNNGDPHLNQLYLNGVQQTLSQQLGTTPSSAQVTTQAKIGSWDNAGYYFTGLVDEVQIFNGALPASQIQSIYESGAAGVCVAETPTTTAVTSSENPANTGDTVTFTATFTPSAATGTITFMDGTTQLGSPITISGGQAQFPTSALAFGTHAITAVYNGDTNYSGSTSSPLSQVITINGSQSAPLPTGLVSWWKGDGNDGDQTGLNPLTLFNGAGYAPGIVNQAFSFTNYNGWSSSYARNSSAQSIPASGPIGFAAWVKYNSNDSAGNNPEVLTLDSSNACGGNGILHGILLGGRNTVAIARGCGATPNFNCSANVNIGDNNWHLVVTGWDGTNATVYVDGVQKAQCSGTDFTRDTSYVSLGGRPDQDGYNSPYNGLEDEVQIYNRALTAAEVQQIYAAGSYGVSEGGLPSNEGLKVASSALPAGYAGTPYTQPLSASGGSGTGYSWTVPSIGDQSSLAALGLSLSPGGVLSGSNPVQGSATFTVQVTDSASNTATAPLSITINQGLTITGPFPLPTGVQGHPYGTQLNVTGGSGTDYTWTVVLQDQPSLAALGLSLSSGGWLSGYPNAGEMTFGVNVTDSVGNVANKTFPVTINPPLTITTNSLPSGTVGTPYSQPLSYSGGLGPTFTWSVSQSDQTQLSNLGLSLSSDGVLSGSNLTAGSATFWAQVTDSLNDHAMTGLSVTINSSGQNISGQISLTDSNSCSSVSLPPFTVSINYPSAQTPTLTTTDSYGNYNFTGIPSGTYTITPSMTGSNLPEYLFYPSSSGVTVNNADVTGQNYQVELGYTVTGTVNYSGSATGPIYVEMTPNCGGNNSATNGTNISAPGPYTIHGVPPGNYTINAWRDNLGYGQPNASNATGSTSGVAITTSNLSGQNVTLSDPSAVSLSGQTPSFNVAGAFNNGVLFMFNSITQQ